jgi:hypothetical protein
MLLSVGFDQDSVVLRAKIRSLTSNGRDGKTGLTFNSAGLAISVISDSEAAPTVYLQAAGNIEDIATLGTYQVPSGGKCRFKELHASRHPGIYEFQFANSIFSVTNAKSLILSITGAADIVECDYLIPLPKLNPYQALLGSGADTCTINLTVAGQPVADASVWITADQVGANVVAGTVRTDSNGNIKLLLDHGSTYYLWAQKDGMNPIMGQQFVAQRD